MPERAFADAPPLTRVGTTIVALFPSGGITPAEEVAWPRPGGVRPPPRGTTTSVRCRLRT